MLKMLSKNVQLFIILLTTVGCSQVTHKASSYTRTVTTELAISSNVPAEVWISDQKVGVTPISYPYSYEEEVDRQVRTANYWETNPGSAAALTVASFGFYLPFSFIPAEPTSETQPSGKYLNNKVTLRLIADGYEPIEQTLELKGEPSVEAKLDLKPTTQ